MALLVGVRLIRLAVTIRRVYGTRYGTCRGAGLLGIGVLVGGLAVAALPLAVPTARALVAVVGLAGAVLAFLMGILLLPGAATTVATRVRRGFDGLSIGITLAFAAWLVPPTGPMPPEALAAGLLVAAGLSVVTVTALRAARYRPAVLLSGSGSGIAMLGLTAMAMLLAYGVASWTLLVAAVPLVVGPLLISTGAHRAPAGPPPPSTIEAESRLSAYPLLSVPAMVATLAALYHLLTVGEFDHTSIVLGLAGIPAMVVREVLSAMDIRSYARRLAQQEAHFRSMVSGGNDLTMVVGDDLLVRWQSPAAARLFGLADADVIGRSFGELMHPDDAADVTTLLTGVLAQREQVSDGRTQLVAARLRDGHGAWRDTESTISDQRAVPEVGALVVHMRDVGERRRLERTLHQLAFTDQLTGLANRRELMRTVVTQRAVPGHGGALLVIDLHGMAGINDVRGREVGDAVLIEVGRRLRTTVGSDDVAARLSGDEFAIITVEGPVMAYALATKLLTALTEPYQLPGAIVHLHVSIGLAEVAGGDSVDDVLRRADLARRRARQLGRNRVEWYDAYMEEQLIRRMDLERELPGAAERGELDLVYQPVLGLDDGRPVGVEALLRWRSPMLGTVLPNELLPVAEDLALIDEVGKWVRQRACRQLAAWSHSGHDLWMAVNVSQRELAAPDFVSAVAATLAAHRIAPERLVVEIAESRVAADVPSVVTQLAGLRALGVRTALDDFGAGQASLAQLRRLPVDILKIDRALVADPADRRGPSKPLIDVVVSLGRRLGLEILAEGLESTAQVDQAREAGCRFAQGFALARPAPAERIEAFLADFQTPSV
ncbi:EAL domain-containing protein [Micromonospora sp. NPDC049679]|uniref:putative bifunctional diguanylate cyclase/phosphodiesterase n=1 Tax=Micromonospora sp. NPDC049679 TaxID=3155920 RepID=UPI0033FD4E42